MSGPRTVVSVTFEGMGRAGQYALGSDRSGVVPGAWVIVESGRGRRLGRVTTPATEIHKGGGGRIRKVVRLANEQELARQREAAEREPEAFRLALVAIRARRLPIKLVQVSLDAIAERAHLCVVAPDRIQLQDLVAELSDALDLRVTIKQLGTRDVARVLGGLGRCGQELCCSTFLDEYPRTSVRMAKDQGLSLNDDRSSGVCGRTLCCLAYEQEFYKERRGFLPKLGKRAVTTSGLAGKCIGADVMQLTFTLVTDDGQRHRVHARDWERNVGRELPDEEGPEQGPEPVPALASPPGVAPGPATPQDSPPRATRGGAADAKKPRRRRRGPKTKPKP